MSDDDRSLLDALMTAAGVRPLDRGARGGKVKGARPPRPARPAPAGAGPPAAGPGPQAPPLGPSRAPPVAAAPAPPRPSPPVGAPVGGPAALATASAARLAALLAERDALLAERDALLAARATLTTLLAETEAARDGADHERRALARKIAALRDQRPDPSAAVAPLPELLARRGLLPAEHAPALAVLLAALPQPTLDALAAPATLPALLDQHLVLLCPAEACQRLAEGGASLRVAPDRCEICGGSDTASAWRHLAAACAARGLQRLVIVGGSPTYRRQLRELAGDGPLRLDLVDGRAQPAARKVKTMARTADLVVIWCATILDHATTNAFVAAGVQPLQVPHRGIGRMLGWLAAAVEGLPRT